MVRQGTHVFFRHIMDHARSVKQLSLKGDQGQTPATEDNSRRRPWLSFSASAAFTSAFLSGSLLAVTCSASLHATHMNMWWDCRGRFSLPLLQC